LKIGESHVEKPLIWGSHQPQYFPVQWFATMKMIYRSQIEERVVNAAWARNTRNKTFNSNLLLEYFQRATHDRRGAFGWRRVLPTHKSVNRLQVAPTVAVFADSTPNWAGKRQLSPPLD